MQTLKNFLRVGLFATFMFVSLQSSAASAQTAIQVSTCEQALTSDLEAFYADAANVSKTSGDDIMQEVYLMGERFKATGEEQLLDTYDEDEVKSEPHYFVRLKSDLLMFYYYDASQGGTGQLVLRLVEPCNGQ